MPARAPRSSGEPNRCGSGAFEICQKAMSGSFRLERSEYNASSWPCKTVTALLRCFSAASSPWERCCSSPAAAAWAGKQPSAVTVTFRRSLIKPISRARAARQRSPAIPHRDRHARRGDLPSRTSISRYFRHPRRDADKHAPKQPRRSPHPSPAGALYANRLSSPTREQQAADRCRKEVLVRSDWCGILTLEDTGDNRSAVQPTAWLITR